MLDLWRRTGHTPDGDLYRKDVTKEMRITDDTLRRRRLSHSRSRARVIEQRLEDEGSLRADTRRELHAWGEQGAGATQEPSAVRRASLQSRRPPGRVARRPR